MRAAVGFDHVVKSFGPVQLLHGVSFDLAPGSVKIHQEIALAEELRACE